MSLLRSIDRPSYAAVTATAALVVALCGSSYAAVQINGREIKPHSMPANRLQKDAVVAAARTAGTTDQIVRFGAKAKKHGRADNVGGVVRLDEGQTVTLLHEGQFTISASCAANGRVEVYATSSAGGWYYGLSDRSGGSAWPAGYRATLASSSGNQVQFSQLVSAVLIGANGEVLHLGAIEVGSQALGAPCVATGYAVRY